MHFSADTLQRLKTEAEEGADNWVSTNEALLAHVYTLLLDAAGVDDRERCGVHVSVDLRGKVGELIPQRMLGRAVVNTNAAGGDKLVFDLSEPTKAGERVHNAMREELEPSKLLCRHEAGNYFWARYASLINPTSPESTHDLDWNFQGKSPYYAIDVGAGKPVRGVPWNLGEGIKVAPFAQGGLDVFISDMTEMHGWAEHDIIGDVMAANLLANSM